MAIIVLFSPPLPLCAPVSHNRKMRVALNLAFYLSIWKTVQATFLIGWGLIFVPTGWWIFVIYSSSDCYFGGGRKGIKKEKELLWLLVTCFSSIPGFTRPSGWRVLRAICTFHHSVVSLFADMPCPQCKWYMPLTRRLRETLWLSLLPFGDGRDFRALGRWGGKAEEIV